MIQFNDAIEFNDSIQSKSNMVRLAPVRRWTVEGVCGASNWIELNWTVELNLIEASTD